MDRMDDMEFNPATPCPPSTVEFYERRRKLILTWEREMFLCEKDAPELHAVLEKLWTNYQERLRMLTGAENVGWFL